MNLTISSNVYAGNQRFIADLPPVQHAGWRRSIRRLGGPWIGSFTFSETSRNAAMDYFNQVIGGDLTEYHAGVKTWRGIIVEVDEPVRNGDRWDCVTSAAGYAHTLAWQLVDGAYVDGAMGNASDWIADLVDDQDEFISGMVIETNTMQIKRQNQFGFTLWDEITRITELGDGSDTPWAFWIDSERIAHYAAQQLTPQYYSRGGLVRRRSLLKTYNYISGQYYDETNTIQTLAAAVNTESQSRYGTRQLTLRRSGFPTTAMESLRDTTLAENCYPQPRVLSSVPGITLYDVAGRPIDPWLIQPLPVKDLLFPSPPSAPGALITDDSITLIDEVVASESGLSLRSWDYTEASLMEAQYTYAQATEESDYDLTD
jgi:hypothetical protein